MTPEQIDQMPAGSEMNALIETEIFGAVSLTDEEFEIFKATYLMTQGPHNAQNVARPMKVPLDEREWYTKLLFQLKWPGDYSSDAFGASRRIVDRMRADGWRFAMEDEAISNNVVSVTFFRPSPTKVWLPCPTGLIKVSALGDTDALAICRAALKAKLMEVKSEE